MAQIVVRIPKEIKEYKEKIILGLNARQLLSTAAVAAIIGPLFYFVYFNEAIYISSQVFNLVVMLIAMPIFAFGWVRWNNMTFEQILVVWFKFNIHRKKSPASIGGR